MKLAVSIDKVITLLLIFFAIVGLIIFGFLNFEFSKNNESYSNSSPIEVPKVDVDKIVAEIKDKNSNLEYESNNILEFISLAFKENDRYKSFIVDTETGKYLEFKDLIREDKILDFETKELELLKYKYPEFIVNGINSSNGYKIYYVKDTEVIIYYYDYEFLYNYNEVVSLRIDYNEIKDYLNFSYKLNEFYELENGFNYSKDKKTVALTFDDGPSRTYNSKILEELNKNKARATFFMVGTMMYSCQKCVIDTYNSGNEIGSHTYEHINISKNSVDNVNQSLYKTNAIYYKLTNDNIKSLRPPYGSYNKENLYNINVPLVLWNLDTEDWRYRNTERIVNHVMENIEDGSIILMHELYETSYEAIKILLPKLYAEGYQIVSVSELANIKGKSLQKGHAYSYFK